jgi:hypothetical protein
VCLLVLLLALLPVCKTIQPFRINFNFGRRPSSPAAQSRFDGSTDRNASAPDAAAAAAPGDAAVVVPQGTAVPMAAAVPLAGGTQQVIPIPIPAGGTMNLVVMAPPGVHVRHTNVQPHFVHMGADPPSHHALHAQDPSHFQGQSHHHHQHHHHHPGCRHQPTPGQRAVQQMLQLASQQCSQAQHNNPGAPFHWPDRVLVCAHEPGERESDEGFVALWLRSRVAAELHVFVSIEAMAVIDFLW